MRTGLMHLTALVTLLLSPLAVVGQSDAQLLAQADAAFDDGVQHRTLLMQARRSFSLAADRYRELHQRGIRTPALYVNLCQAATLADRKPEALWACHMGLRLDPNDPTLREHLAFLRDKVLYPPTGQGRLDADPWPAWLHRPTLYELILISSVAYTLVCALGTLAFLRPSSVCVWATLLCTLIAISAGLGVWHEGHTRMRDRDTPLVIVTENAPLYRGNATSYPTHPSLALLPRGMEVRQLHRRGDWLQVRLTTGEIGWLPVSNALIVEPGAGI